LTSTALARSAPSASATYGATPGVTRSGVIVETMIWSTSSAVRPASSSAISQARVASSDSGWSGAMMRRSRMPVRRTIHSSLVSRRWTRSSLVTTV